MIDIKAIQHLPIPEIIRTLGALPRGGVTGDLKQLIMPTVLSLANIFSVEPNFVVERLDAMKGKLRYMVAGYDF